MKEPEWLLRKIHLFLVGHCVDNKKYLNMDKGFGLSLLCLLLIIPQHGNSPVPRMETWMEMDQGDGFVDRDLTSSLTGAESFGSAHKNYQKALIRKKQANIEDEEKVGELSSRFSDRMGRRSAINPNYMQNQYASYGYNNYLMNSGASQRAFQQPMVGMNAIGCQDQRYRMQLSNSNERASNLRFDNRFPSSGVADLTSKDSSIFYRSPRGEDITLALNSQLAKSERLDANGRMIDILNPEEAPNDSEYTFGSECTQGRVKNDLTDDDLRAIQMDNGQEQNENLNGEDQEDEGVEESDYYSEVRNPAIVRGDADVDYNEVNPHGIIYKREETKIHGAKSENNFGEMSLRGKEEVKSVKESRSNNLLKAEAPKEARDITKDDAVSKLNKGNIVWTMSSNVESNDLEKAMKDSSRTFGVVQEISPGKSQYYHDSFEWKNDNYEDEKKGSIEEKRNKREDEDEQKNMKTGTDEGGGEYEDEEGKGHNDEEEYYEEAEISSGLGIRAENPSFNHYKMFKRETGKDEEGKESVEGKRNEDVASNEFQLSLKNAPVEHEEKCKKSSWHEGVGSKKSVSRRGMKIWDEWGNWSPCSVTCGVGRKTRWRHCIGGGCSRGEKEALIKKCTYPAC